MTTTNIQPPDIESNKIVKARRKTTQSDSVVTVIIESRGSDNFFSIVILFCITSHLRSANQCLYVLDNFITIHTIIMNSKKITSNMARIKT